MLFRSKQVATPTNNKVVTNTKVVPKPTVNTVKPTTTKPAAVKPTPTVTKPVAPAAPKVTNTEIKKVN